MGVSLYDLQGTTGLHRDTLKRLCDRRRKPIHIQWMPVSTDRYFVRTISDEDVPRLLRAAANYRRKRRKAKAGARARGPVPPIGPGWPYARR